VKTRFLLSVLLAVLCVSWLGADVGYGPNLFYFLRHDTTGFSTFGTISTSGAITDRFGVGNDFDALAFASADLGYGSNLFYYVRHDNTGFSTFGTISTSGAITDRFGVGNGFDALTFASADLGYGTNLFYYLRHDTLGFSTFGTISTSGAITDRFGVGNDFDALTFASADVGYGSKLFYYLRHDNTGFSTFGTISTSGAIADRFGVGNNFDALVFTSRDLGYGPDLFYHLRHDNTGFSTFGTISTSGAITDRFGVGNNFNELTIDAPGATIVGTHVVVTPEDETTGTTPAAVTFANVTQAGSTSLTTSALGPPIPAAFALGNPPVFYDISTTAGFTGPIVVCIDFSGVTFPNTSVTHLLHFEGDAWVDVTSPGGAMGSVICGEVSSFSPFAVVRERPSSPPTLDVTVTPNSLWPPNNKLVRVAATIQVSDVQDISPGVVLASITSSEPLQPGDIAGAALGTDCRSFQLRATRAGSGAGRIYTITYRATNALGGSTVRTVQVVVPHDQGK
jgi:hypothetical protein